MTTTVRLSRSTARLAGGVAAAGLVVTLVGACSGGSTTTTAAAGNTAPTAAPGASGQPNQPGQGRGRIDQAQLQKITQCLEAAGIAVPTFSPRAFPSGSLPNFTPGDRPSGFPTGVRPSGFPTGARGGGGVFQVLQDPKAQAALQACGIAVPTFGPRPSASASA